MNMIEKFSEKSLDENFKSGEKIFQGKLLHVRRDVVQLPNGEESTREYIRHPGAVAVVPILPDGRIILVKQCRYPLNTVMWEIPAGKLDHGADEDLLSCAKRELSEETGYEAAEWQELGTIATTPGFSDELIHLFVARGLSAHAQHTDEDEFIGVQAFSTDEIRAMFQKGRFFDAKSICALYALEIKNHE